MLCNKDTKTPIGWYRCSRCHSEWHPEITHPFCTASIKEIKHADLDLGDEFTPPVKHILGCPINYKFNGDAVDAVYSLRH